MQEDQGTQGEIIQEIGEVIARLDRISAKARAANGAGGDFDLQWLEMVSSEAAAHLYRATGGDPEKMADIPKLRLADSQEEMEQRQRRGLASDGERVDDA